jgi:hypothetical protein
MSCVPTSAAGSARGPRRAAYGISTVTPTDSTNDMSRTSRTLISVLVNYTEARARRRAARPSICSGSRTLLRPRPGSPTRWPEVFRVGGTDPNSRRREPDHQQIAKGLPGPPPPKGPGRSLHSSIHHREPVHDRAGTHAIRSRPASLPPWQVDQLPVSPQGRRAAPCAASPLPAVRHVTTRLDTGVGEDKAAGQRSLRGSDLYFRGAAPGKSRTCDLALGAGLAAVEDHPSAALDGRQVLATYGPFSSAIGPLDS